MSRAVDLAQSALTLSNPNPRVGCVITAPDGREIGIGHTQQAGGPHAEVMALRAAQAAGFEGPLGAHAAAVFRAAHQAGMADLDDAALLAFLRQTAPRP